MTTDEPDTIPDPYAVIGELYDLEHDPFADDLPMILHFAGQSDLPVLELGCGTGRVLQALAEHGQRATGVDRSGPMLAAARQRIATLEDGDLVTLVQGDMEAVAAVAPGPFGLAIFSLNALMHVSSLEDQLAALRSTFDVLGPDSAVLIDLMHPHPEQLVHLGSGVLLEGSWALPDDYTDDKWSHRSIRPAPQLIATTLWYDIIGPTGDIRRVRTAFEHRYVHAAELRFMLESAGYTETELFGDYDLGPFDDDSDRLIAYDHNRMCES